MLYRWNKTVPGLVRFVASALQYTSMRMSRDNAQGDLSTFQARIDLNQDAEELLAGMTVEVKLMNQFKDQIGKNNDWQDLYSSCYCSLDYRFNLWLYIQ